MRSWKYVIFFNSLLFLIQIQFVRSQLTTNGLVLNLDASNPSSYSGIGSTWNDTSGNNKDFNINTATYNNGGYFVFDGNDGMTGPPSNSFGLSQTDHTIEIVLMNTTITNQSVIHFRGNSGDAYSYGINAHIPWGNNKIYYDVGGCCDVTNRISGSVNILNQKVHVILRSKPSGNDRRQVFLNGNSILGSGGNSTSNPGFTNGAASIGFLNGHGHYFKGRLYSVRVYNRALTDQEIANNYSYYQDPRNISISSNTVTENSSIGTTIGNFSSTGMNQNGTFTYTLASSGDSSDDDNGSFTISGTSLLTSTTLDFETKNSYNIYINVNDGANNYAKAFTVSVTNINEAPTDIGISSTAINSDAYKFNGTNSYIEVPYAAVNHPAEFTIELWARLDQTTNNFQSPLSSRYGSAPWNNLSGYNFYAVNGLEKWSFTGGSGAWESINTSTSTNGEIYNGNTLKFGIWTHLASTYDGTTYRFYVNGILVGTKTAGYSRVGFNSIPARPLRIGAGRTEGSATYFFNGAVDEVRIWNYARTQNQINYNKNFNLSGQESGLISYYQFEGGSATNKTGANGTNGTLHNSPTTVSGTILFPTSGSNSGNVDEESTIGTLVGNLIANDPDSPNLTYSLVGGNGTNDMHNSLFSVSGNQLLVAGNIDYETNSTLNIYLQVSDGVNASAGALTINVNDINEIPAITETTVSDDNLSINVTFSEAVFSTNGGSGALETSDFALSINGGTASLSSSTPSSISINGNTYTLGIAISGSINGSEIVTVVPIQNSIYDSGAAIASTNQSSNSVSLHGDSDSDGVNDALDQCPNTPNGASVDSDGCAESQKDPDNDGITGVNDNCPNTANASQLDTDGDGIGDLCDPDMDGDGVTNELDNCPMDYNPDQSNNDNDSRGDICDTDDDNDGYSDIQDFFPFDPNEWLDTDRDGIGNNADTDDDNDSYLDDEDAFPIDPREWLDTDGDGIGNNKDKDDDNDGVEDIRDAFPLDENEHLDTDQDGIGNNADEDDDEDGYKDQDEIECGSDPLKKYRKPKDYDNDFIPDCIDLDDDNDGCLDEEDILPLNENECLDTDGDGIPDNSDFDADNDGVSNFNDDFPLDPNESKDTDGDGIGDNEDKDDNNDGFPEDPILNDFDEEVIPLFVSELLTPNEPGEESVWRIINIDKYSSANVKVYSQAGIIVFESWDYQNDWKGTDKKGNPLPSGPYFYRIDRANETTVEEGWMYIFN